MKYFTPERFIRLQDRTKEESVRAAMAEWESAILQYDLYLQTILGDLPKPIRSFVQSASLHDAQVLAIWQESPKRLKLIVQREDDPAHLLLLSYALAAPP